MLDQLGTWYAAQCDGEWEHEYGVTIATQEDGGWHLRVDLVGTALAGDDLARDLVARGENDWVEVWSDGYTFDAMGGPGNLSELLAAFSRFADSRVTPG
jgi:Immunity protein 53